MATRRENKRTPAKNNSEAKKYNPVRILRVNKGDDLKTLYAKVRKAFTAADLQCFTQDEEMVPAEQVLEEFEAMVREGEKRKKKRTAR
jgi:hypothetical protein